MRWLRAGLWVLALVPALELAGEFRGLPHLGILHDDALYVANAKALATGEGHRQINLPDRPWQTKYPPLFPAWISMAWRANPDFPANRDWFLPLVWIWLPAFALLSRVVFRDLGFDEDWALAMSAAMLLNPLAAYFGVSVMAELMLGSMLLVCLALAERGRGFAAGAVAALAFLVKSAALPVLITIPMVFGVRKRFRQAMYFAVIAWPVFLGWTLWAAAHRSGAPGDYYTDYLGFYLANHGLEDLPSLLEKNVPVMAMGAGHLMAFTAETTTQSSYLGTLLGLIGFFGFFRLGGRLTHYHAFVAAFLAMLAVWNFTPHERFVLPILPFLIAGVAAELRRFATLFPAAKYVGLAFVATTVFLNSAAMFGTFPSIAHKKRAEQERLEPVYRWIAEQSPTDARFAAACDPLVYLHTGRTARGMHFPTRYFYREQRASVMDYFENVPGFAEHYGLDWALVLPNDHSMDLTPEEVRRRADRVSHDPRLSLATTIGSAKIFRVGGR